MTALLWLTVGLPVAAAVLVRVAPRFATVAAPAGALAAAVPAWVLLGRAAGGDEGRSLVEWLPGLDVGLRLDGLSAVMTATVATVGLVVVAYSVGYFADEPRRASALAGLLAFLAAMQGLVLADGYLMLLVFWELVGAASARLIAFSRNDPRAPGAAVRAFLTTRTADIGFYLAVLALFAGTGSLAFASERPDGTLGAIVGIGLVAAAMGKSAQAPLQTWLSAAMAGPTPVSALLHSATMVAAGVYLLARSHELLAGWPLEIAGWIGGITAVAGACIALGQVDLKRLLAGSTTSQLGLMFVGVAAGGPAVAVFHLVAHAAGKAGLFLAAGVFQHARGTTDLAGLRGAGRDDRAAFAGFTINALSIAAAPPLAAFWSKDHIAAAAQPDPAWFVLVLAAAAGSAAYLLRPWLVLAAHERGRPAPDGRAAMLAGVAATAAASLTLGLAADPLVSILDAPELPATGVSVVLSLLAVAAGATAVLLRPGIPARAAAAAREQLYANALIRLLVQRPVMAAARAAHAFDVRVVDAMVDGLGRAGLAAARAQDWIELRVIDAAVDGLAQRTRAAGTALRRLQSGRLFEYLRDAVLGGAAVAVVVALSALL
jgi:NADH-quinone oxidoreductase subunit L